jgi:hypothetical protein
MRAVRESGFVFVDAPVIRYQTGEPSLIRSANLGPLLIDSYRTMHQHYRERRGTAEFILLRLVAAWQQVHEPHDQPETHVLQPAHAPVHG